jgi:16S rRNA (cytosine967-C5)-methyltransferase
LNRPRPHARAGARSGPRTSKASSAGQAGVAARAAALRILSSVLDDGQALDSALETYENSATITKMATRERAFTRAMVGKTLRHLGQIRALLAGLIAKPPHRAGALDRILELATAQIMFMEAADHAAVSLAVDQVADDLRASRYKGLANAVLRRLVREKPQLLATVEAPNLNTPPWLWERWVTTWGEPVAKQIAAAHAIEPYLDVSTRADPAPIAKALGGTVLPTGSVRLIPSGPVEALPGFADGTWWVQDTAASLPVRLLGDVAGLKIADLCAAPGGKTAALAAAGAAVTAVDISAERLHRLTANLTRLGLSAEVVTADILAWQPETLFDAVLLDAPCTSTGTIRRHPDIAHLKKPADIPALASLQAQMIDQAAKFLKPGGRLVYCSCSLEPEEGEHHVTGTIERNDLDLERIEASEISGLEDAITAQGTLRTLPGHLTMPSERLSGMDGFFAMRLRKR